MRTKILAIIIEFWQKLRESEKLPLVLVLVFVGSGLFTLFAGSFLDYLSVMPEEQLRAYLESWEQFFANIFFYLLAGTAGLFILWLVVTLILLLVDLLGITLASISGLVRGFVTELFYWTDRLKKSLKKSYGQRPNNRL